MCAPDGGVIDDLIVYRTAPERFLVVPNAANRETVAVELGRRLAGHDAELADATLSTSLLAVQGPAARTILATLTDSDPGSLRLVRRGGGPRGRASRRWWPAPATAARMASSCSWPGTTARPPGMRWREAGAGHGLRPCGLGARDTLRLEAGMPLYGNELDRPRRRSRPGWAASCTSTARPTRPSSREFVGRAALEARAAGPLPRQLVGLVLRDRGIARHGYAVRRPGQAEPIGAVTSGSQSPSLGEAIAMAYVPPSDASPGTMLEVVDPRRRRGRRGRAPAVLPTAALTAPATGPGARGRTDETVEVADGRT